MVVGDEVEVDGVYVGVYEVCVDFFVECILVGVDDYVGVGCVGDG